MTNEISSFLQKPLKNREQKSIFTQPDFFAGKPITIWSDKEKTAQSQIKTLTKKMENFYKSDSSRLFDNIESLKGVISKTGSKPSVTASSGMPKLPKLPIAALIDFTPCDNQACKEIDEHRTILGGTAIGAIVGGIALSIPGAVVGAVLGGAGTAYATKDDFRHGVNQFAIEHPTLTTFASFPLSPLFLEWAKWQESK